jgi:hypothetical protein
MNDTLRQQLVAWCRGRGSAPSPRHRRAVPRATRRAWRTSIAGTPDLLRSSRARLAGPQPVGEEAMHAAWLVSNRRARRPARLPADPPVDRGEATPAQVAYLEDRIAFFERRPHALRHAVRLGRARDAPCRSRTRGRGRPPHRVGRRPRRPDRPGAQKCAGSVPPDYARRQAEMGLVKSVGWVEPPGTSHVNPPAPRSS